MKQIFDWLREQCKDRSESCYKSYLKLRSDEDYGCSFAYAHAVDLINEAEAKWEAEHCCECENCGTKVEKDSNGDYVCGRCGRNTARLRELEEEADCCEWEHRKHYVNCLCKCNGIMIEHDLAIGFTTCPYCEKPIKIVEVE